LLEKACEKIKRAEKDNCMRQTNKKVATEKARVNKFKLRVEIINIYNS
jgi:hypothetical protein